MDKKNKTALKVNPGISQPPIIDNDCAEKIKVLRKKKLVIKELIEGILAGNISIIGQAITIIESTLPEHKVLAREIISACLPHSGNSIRIGITGVPGVGKSTFIESFGNVIINNGHKLAVLAIDPSSEISKGSILGDKTRMETLSTNNSAFIRPSPSKGSLGGVAAKTRETIVICEAAGYDCVLIETVGVGQSETLVHSMTDFFLLLQLAGAGDELQGIKRGIMEMANTIVITKADGTNVNKAKLAMNAYVNALGLFPLPPNGIRPNVLTCSSINNEGINDIWDYISNYLINVKDSGFLEKNRNNQTMFWFYETIKEELSNHFFKTPEVKNLIPQLEQDIKNKKISSFAAANILLDKVFKR